MSKDWLDAQSWELKWWNTCQNTYNEELKQLLYASKMGLALSADNKTPYRFDMKGKSVLDIGGGPVSLLLKCVNVRGMVIDAIGFPQWVLSRYELAGIDFQQIKAEDFVAKEQFDECWIYNVLQHTDDPEKIVINARGSAKILRIFESIETITNIGHIHSFTEDQLNGWLKGEGKVEDIHQNSYRGRAYYGIFIGEKV